MSPRHAARALSKSLPSFMSVCTPLLLNSETMFVCFNTTCHSVTFKENNTFLFVSYFNDDVFFDRTIAMMNNISKMHLAVKILTITLNHSLMTYWGFVVVGSVCFFSEEIKINSEMSAERTCWKHWPKTNRKSCRERGWLWLIVHTFSFSQFWEHLWQMKNVSRSQLNYIVFRALNFSCQPDSEGLKNVLNHRCPALIQSDICHRKLYHM